MDRRRRRRLLALAIGAQIAVPTLALGVPAPTRLGFQMYSGAGHLPIVELISREASTTRVALTDLVAVPRPEIDWSGLLPDALCRSRPGLSEVRLHYPERLISQQCPVTS